MPSLFLSIHHFLVYELDAFCLFTWRISILYASCIRSGTRETKQQQKIRQLLLLLLNISFISWLPFLKWMLDRGPNSLIDFSLSECARVQRGHFFVYVCGMQWQMAYWNMHFEMKNEIIIWSPFMLQWATTKQ